MADRQYELVYILPPETTDQQAAELHEQVAGVVSRMNGTIDKTENWGRRKLAYEIAHFKEGVYVLEGLTGSGACGAGRTRGHQEGQEGRGRGGEVITTFTRCAPGMRTWRR